MGQHCGEKGLALFCAVLLSSLCDKLWSHSLFYYFNWIPRRQRKMRCNVLNIKTDALIFFLSIWHLYFSHKGVFQRSSVSWTINKIKSRLQDPVCVYMQGDCDKKLELFNQIPLKCRSSFIIWMFYIFKCVIK